MNRAGPHRSGRFVAIEYEPQTPKDSDRVQLPFDNTRNGEDTPEVKMLKTVDQEYQTQRAYNLAKKELKPPLAVTDLYADLATASDVVKDAVMMILRNNDALTAANFEDMANVQRFEYAQHINIANGSAQAVILRVEDRVAVRRGS
ncbi:MAG: hypothetical protein M1822_009545 [Bathelium mastoideum]|nr:MAG: hypothetical protein M1822_009545 [Bathelium mastoideum]